MLKGTNNYNFVPLQQKANPVGFILWHTFQVIRMKFDIVLKQFKVDILLICLSRFTLSRQIAAVLPTVSKNITVCMHSDIYEVISLKIGVIVDSNKVLDLFG